MTASSSLRSMEMLKKIILALAFGALLLPVGCTTPRPYPWSWAHNKRRINIVLDGFKETTLDIDRIFLQDITTFPDKLHMANQDLDRIIFGMEERALEDF